MIACFGKRIEKVCSKYFKAILNDMAKKVYVLHQRQVQLNEMAQKRMGRKERGGGRKRDQESKER